MSLYNAEPKNIIISKSYRCQYLSDRVTILQTRDAYPMLGKRLMFFWGEDSKTRILVINQQCKPVS